MRQFPAGRAASTVLTLWRAWSGEDVYVLYCPTGGDTAAASRISVNQSRSSGEEIVMREDTKMLVSRPGQQVRQARPGRSGNVAESKRTRNCVKV